MTEARAELRRLLAEPQMIVAPFVFDCLQARLVERAGFPAVYMSGFGTAAARGYPDLGLLTMTEMISNLRSIARSVGVPVICDADTGYGNPVNVWRTVREYEEAGAAALHIEDQAWPKRCGFLLGKQVAAAESMVAKLKAACQARRDPNLVIIARTDALQVNGWDDALRRARIYYESGADMIFVDGIRTVEDLERYSAELSGMPLVYNGQLLALEELGRYGFKLTIHIGTLLTVYQRMRDAINELKEKGTLGSEARLELVEEIARVMGSEEIEALGRRYGGSSS